MEEIDKAIVSMAYDCPNGYGIASISLKCHGFDVFDDKGNEVLEYSFSCPVCGYTHKFDFYKLKGVEDE